MTPKEFHYAINDWSNEKKYNRRFEMETMRLQTVAIYNMTRYKKTDQLTDPKKLLLFEWEKKDVVPPKILTADEWKQLDEKVAKLTANHKPIGSKGLREIKK